MTRGDGTTFDTDAHVEWGYIIDDWPREGVTSFVAVDSEHEARVYTDSKNGRRRLAKRMVGHAEEVKTDD